MLVFFGKNNSDRGLRWHVGERIPIIAIHELEAIQADCDELEHLFFIDVPKSMLSGRRVCRSISKECALVIYGMLLREDFRKNPIDTNQNKG